MPQLSITFEDNKAYSGGGAIYVIDISPCDYVPSKQNQTSDTAPLFNQSLLVLPQFAYRYIYI